MGILRIVLGMAVVFGCLYVMLMRNSRVTVSNAAGTGPAVTAPGQAAGQMKQQYEEAAKKQDEAADDVQKKLDDAVQGK